MPNPDETGDKIATGIHIARDVGQNKPPLSETENASIVADEIETATLEGETKQRIVTGKIPLQPFVIRAPFDVTGRLAAELTNYKGFLFSEQELADIVAALQACNLEMSPIIQAIITISGVIAAKGIGYALWRRADQPDSGATNPATNAKTAAVAEIKQELSQ